ncbi:MAG TPA: YdcF family protein [Aliidongia sp.]|uniref:YdcF family protein n=1 Tax=Aliidongia sp. TaxID=1914230 RepID=UPI002DDCBC2A|nr:YdcF family protein [Aliidongia sp.]HEV2677318.1 YdcF family protein [Aliidongia sp.]
MFEISKYGGLLLHPSILIFLLCSVGFACSLIRRSSLIGRRLMMLGTAVLVLAALSPADWPMAWLEDRFPEPTALPAHVDGIIVLGGAINLGISAEHGMPALKSGADRMTTFLALARYFPDAKLVFTGGTAAGDGEIREADVAHDLFGALGLDLDRVTFENNSRNTRENALYSKRLVNPGAGETWLLVTSAADMPRAVGCFRAVGWPVTAWPVAYRVLRTHYQLMPHLSRGLANLDWAAHEWAGLVYYKLRGWTDAWFPAPEDSRGVNGAEHASR